MEKITSDEGDANVCMSPACATRPTLACVSPALDHISEVGAGCGKTARPVLCGGRIVICIPAAIRISSDISCATKTGFNSLRIVKLVGAAQEAGRGKAADGQHTYCITPGISMLPPASLPQKAAFYGIGTPTEAELTCVNNHFPLIFFAVPSRSTWLFAVQLGRPVVEFKDTSK